MSDETIKYKRTLNGSIGSGMKSVFGGSGKTYFILEHKISSQYHKAGEEQEIIVDQIEMGRDPRCQVRFDESFTTVSRRHAAIMRDGDNWKLVQLSSTNSTFLNGKRVEKEWYLQNGDEIQLSINGPKLGFIIPTGKRSTVGSIGLSRRLSLFRQQALRPYRRGLVAMAAALVVSIVAAGILIGHQHKMLLDLSAENIIVNETLQKTIEESQRIHTVDSIKMAQQAREHASEIKAVKIATQQAIQNAEERMRTSGLTGIDALIEESGILDDVFFLITTNVYITNGSEQQKIDCYWSGTGFLLSDGKFITARHCIEGWRFNYDTESDLFVATVKSDTEKEFVVKADFLAISSKSNRRFEFSSDDFVIHGHNKQCTFGDDNYYIINLGVPDNSDWAYTTKVGGEVGRIEADYELSRNLTNQQDLYIFGFPKALGVESINSIRPITSHSTVSLSGLNGDGCILYSNSSDNGNSGGPVFAVNDGKLVVVGIVSSITRSSQHASAVPISEIR